MVKQILIDIIDLLNSKLPITVSELADTTNTSSRTITDHLKDIKKYFLKERLINTRGKWNVKKGGFLRHFNMTSEEMAILIGLYRAAENEGGKIGQTYKTIALGHTERIHQYNEISAGQELMSMAMRMTAQTINNAIEQEVKTIFIFEGYSRIVHPFKLFMREHYWYLAGYEETKTFQENPSKMIPTNTMKTYSLYRIKSASNLQEKITYDFSKASELLPLALNGYISWDSPPQEIHMMIVEGLANVLERAGAHRHWTRIHNSSVRKGYVIFRAHSVHTEFRDILPLIMKYSPDIIVLYPNELIEKIHARIYQQVMEIESFKAEMTPLPLVDSYNTN